MTCLAVRDRFPEYALGTAPPADREEVERHLAWCAACRKETAELESAASMLGFALAPVSPDDELEEGVVLSVTGAAARGSGRRARSGLAAVLAAALAVAGLGWGAVMAGRAERTEFEARQRQRELSNNVERLVERLSEVIEMVRELNPAAADADTRMGKLVAASGRSGGGAVLVLVPGRIPDFAFVLASGLSPEAAPYRVTLRSPHGASALVGRISAEDLDADGSYELLREFDRDLGPYWRVVVRDAAGAVVLTADVGPHSKLVSPEG